MNNRKEIKLSEVASLEKRVWKVHNDELPYIGLEHIAQNKLRLLDVGSSKNISSNKFHFNNNNFLFGKLRPYFRKLVRPDFEGVCSTDIWVVKANKGYDKDYLYYLFASKDFIDLAYSGSSGTRMPRANWDFMSDTKWLIPPLKVQKQIAEVLSSLDDKIDLLHRQNKTLEDLAQTIFRKWFIEDADESWEVKKLKELVDIGIGRTPPRKEFHWFSKSNSDVKWISIRDLADSGIFILDTSEYLTTEAVEKFRVPIIPADTVVLSFKMTVGRVAITNEEMLSNEAIAHFKFNEDTPFLKEFLYFYLKTYPYDSLGSTSSIVTSINSGMIKDMDVTIPDKKTLMEFNGIVKNKFRKIRINQKQIKTLEELRDTLLPKLMNGEVGVG